MRGRAWARAWFKLWPVSIPATMCRRLRRARHTDTLDRRLQTTCHAAKRAAVRASQAWHSRGGSFPSQQRSLSPRKSTRGRPLHASLSQRAHGLESAPPTGCARPVVTASGWRRRARTRAACSRGASCSRALAAASAVGCAPRVLRHRRAARSYSRGLKWVTFLAAQVAWGRLGQDLDSRFRRLGVDGTVRRAGDRLPSPGAS